MKSTRPHATAVMLWSATTVCAIAWSNPVQPVCENVSQQASWSIRGGAPGKCNSFQRTSPCTDSEQTCGSRNKNTCGGTTCIFCDNASGINTKCMSGTANAIDCANTPGVSKGCGTLWFPTSCSWFPKIGGGDCKCGGGSKTIYSCDQDLATFTVPCDPP